MMSSKMSTLTSAAVAKTTACFVVKQSLNHASEFNVETRQIKQRKNLEKVIKIRLKLIDSSPAYINEK